jgi:hypothetical protein
MQNLREQATDERCPGIGLWSRTTTPLGDLNLIDCAIVWAIVAMSRMTVPALATSALVV